MVELIESMNLPDEHKQTLNDALGVLAVTAHRLGLSPSDEKGLLCLVIEFVAESR